MNKTTCPLDYFGVAANQMIQDLINQSSNNRKRKTALHNLVRLAKASGLLRRDEDVFYVGLEVNLAGVPVIAFIHLTAVQKGRNPV